MWDSVSGKAVVVIILAIAALFLLRFLSKRSFKLIQPTWLGTQKQSAQPQTAQQSIPIYDTFRKDTTTW